MSTYDTVGRSKHVGGGVAVGSRHCIVGVYEISGDAYGYVVEHFGILILGVLHLVILGSFGCSGIGLTTR